MIPGYYEMIAAFICDHIRPINGGLIPPNPRAIQSGLFMMLAAGWTQEDVKREAIREYNVIIRDDLFPRRV